MVEDRLDAASDSPEMNYPILEGGIIIAESGHAIDSDGNEYTWTDEADEYEDEELAEAAAETADLSDSEPPTWSGSVTVSSSSTNSGSVTVSWESADDNYNEPEEIDYPICYRTSSTACTSSWTTSASTSNGTLSHTIDGLANNTH